MWNTIPLGSFIQFFWGVKCTRGRYCWSPGEGEGVVDAMVAGAAAAVAGPVTDAVVDAAEASAAGGESAWAGVIAVTPRVAATAKMVVVVIVRNRFLGRQFFTRAPLCVLP